MDPIAEASLQWHETIVQSTVLHLALGRRLPCCYHLALELLHDLKQKASSYPYECGLPHFVKLTS